MKTTINYNGKDVQIDLTPAQIAEAKKQSISYTDIKCLQDALDYIGESLDSFNNRTQFDDDAQKAYKELEVIVLAIRQGNELGERWYYPWFNSKSSSSGFSYRGYNDDSAFSLVGSRLCVENSDKAKYLGKQFLETYDRYINADKLAVKDPETPLVNPTKTFASYTDIKTFEDACIVVGIDHLKFSETNKNLSPDTYAYEQLKVISKALNGGNHMDYTDTGVTKYYPYFNSVGSSSGFSYCDYSFGFTLSAVGSRLTYRTSDIAKYAGNQFLDIYNKYIN
ncbi:hypothetical protein E2P86_08035 [Sphingobacterium psychroaquaticum]|uniref:hypothetical protein n=1 Tax=Sphingobacterium psychroaquaticum TaxID=561061 RepID=UPI00106AC641|nr:hypothetical protein [Sphingobacterium psychroaquaticum]QBQ41106.1 hypothetical protein E2P86_08035 [Sphingobacterium psychroaquaticum]